MQYFSISIYIKNKQKFVRENMDEEKIIKIMHDHITGLSITEIVTLTKISRSAVRTNLARLEGANKVKARKIGMAKVYILNQNVSEINRIIENNISYEPLVKQLLHQFQKDSSKKIEAIK
jgi:predicted transcriptional regulator